MLGSKHGSCPCGGTFEEGFVLVTMTVAGSKVTLEDVPQGSCPVCGSRVYKVPVLARIEAAMKNVAPQPAAT
jgi:YgiT-type zinc finger domain-containing protein